MPITFLRAPLAPFVCTLDVNIDVLVLRPLWIPRMPKLKITTKTTGQGDLLQPRTANSPSQHSNLRRRPETGDADDDAEDGRAQQQDAPKPDISWTARVDPGARTVRVAGRIAGASRKDIAGINAFDRSMADVKIKRTSQHGEDLQFEYEVPIAQEGYGGLQQPVLNGRRFCGFGKHLLLLPKLKDRPYTCYGFSLEAPDGWKRITNRGVDGEDTTLAFEELEDLTDLLICAGDYATHTCELENREGPPTQCILALRGEREFSDMEYFETTKKMMRAQVDYFGGCHPAPRQMIALHLLDGASSPDIPGFNNRAPGHDSVVGAHTPQRPWGHFEFFGMLSHEHMHNWFPHVLRTKLGPWFAEGLNDYVAYGILYDANLHDREQFGGMLTKWYREYQWCVRNPDAPLVPYRRGMIAAWVFDLEIGRTTEGRKGLKDLLLHLLENTPRDQAVDRKQFLEALTALIGEEAEALYVKLVEAEEAIELAPYLEGTRYMIEDGRITLLAP